MKNTQASQNTDLEEKEKCKHIFSQMVSSDTLLHSGNEIIIRFFCTKCLLIESVNVTESFYEIKKHQIRYEN